VVYSGPLAGGQQDKVSLDIRLDDPRQLEKRVRVEITGGHVPD
jgi:hypothetical protein